MTITVTFDPPLPSDSPATFNTKAFATLGDLNDWSTQANALAASVNADEAAAAASASTAGSAASAATTQAGIATTKASEAATSASNAATSASTATTQAGIATTKAAEAAASAASIAPGSLLPAANPSYTGTLTGGTGVVNLGSGQFVKDASGNVGVGTASPAGKLELLESTNANCVEYITARGGNAKTAAVLFRTNTAGGAGSGGGIGHDGTNLILHSGGATLGSQFALDASGNLLVGTASAAGGSGVRSSFHSSHETGAVSEIYATNASYSGNALLIYANRNTTNGSFNAINYYNAGSLESRFTVKDSGNCQNINNSYGAFSDLKLKENIVDVSPKLAKLLQVRIVNYTLKADPDKTKLIGVIAQELEQISPGLIEETPDYEEVTKTREVAVPEVPAVLDDEGNEVTPAVPASTKTEEYTERVPTGTTTKSVKYSVFVPMLIKGLQEQHAIVQSMQSQLDAQNEAMQLLAARLAALETKGA